jgi:uncharacterized protein (TIGR03067 family)
MEHDFRDNTIGCANPLEFSYGKPLYDRSFSERFNMMNMMSRLFVIGILFQAILPIASADEAKEKAIREDRQKIQGTWRITAIEVNGKQTKPEDLRQFRVVNGSDGTWSLRDGDKEISRGTSIFDPTKNPKTIDFTATDDQGSEQHLGIYELGERTRKLCFAPPDKSRPQEFASPIGSGNVLVVFTRVDD